MMMMGYERKPAYPAAFRVNIRPWATSTDVDAECGLFAIFCTHVFIGQENTSEIYKPQIQRTIVDSDLGRL